MSAVYFQLPREAQAWVRDAIARHRLPFPLVADVLAEAVRYGAGEADAEDRSSRDAPFHRAAATYHRGS